MASTNFRVLAAVVVTLSWLAVRSPEPAFGWRQEIDGDGATSTSAVEVASAVAIDGAGDVIATGTLHDAASTDVVTVKLDGDGGAEVWRNVIVASSITGGAVPSFVTLDATGDAFVGYRPFELFGGVLLLRRFAVAKIDGVTGAELWRRDIVGTFDEGEVLPIVVDGNGDVVVGGHLINTGTFRDFTVIKFSGADGSELWRHEANVGGLNYFEAAFALRIDSSGDVLAGGQLGARAHVVKLDGGTGDLVWEYDYTSSSILRGTGFDLTSAGDVVASIDDFCEFCVTSNHIVKIAGDTGLALWDHDDGQARNEALVVDQNDDVVVAGNVFVGNLAAGDFARDASVMKVAGDDGGMLWRRTFDGRGNGNDFDDQDILTQVAVDGAGDVLAAGELLNGTGQGFTGQDFTVVKLAGADGVRMWLQEIDGRSLPSADTARSLAIDAQGNAVASGTIDGGTGRNGDFAVVKLSGLDGAVGPLRGHRLNVQDYAGDPTKRRITAELRDRILRAPAPGSAGDPMLAGARLMLLNPATMESTTFVLPAGPAWKGLGSPARSRGYLYRDPTGTNGPCTTVRVMPGTVAKAVCTGKRGSIPFDLDEAMQNALTVSLQLGAGVPQCATYGGTIGADAGTASPGPKGIFRATKSAATLGDCPAP